MRWCVALAVVFLTACGGEAETVVMEAASPEAAVDGEQGSEAASASEPIAAPVPVLGHPSYREALELLREEATAALGDDVSDGEFDAWLAAGPRRRVEGRQWRYELQYARSGTDIPAEAGRDFVIRRPGPGWVMAPGARGGGGGGLGTAKARYDWSIWLWAIPLRPEHVQALEDQESDSYWQRLQWEPSNSRWLP